MGVNYPFGGRYIRKVEVETVGQKSHKGAVGHDGEGCQHVEDILVRSNVLHTARGVGSCEGGCQLVEVWVQGHIDVRPNP